MDFLVMLGFIIAVNWLCLTLVWLISLKIKDVGIVDIYWGIGFVIMAWACLLFNLQGNTSAISQSQWLINIMVTLWGLRLSFHLAARNLGKEEDYRYAAMRKKSAGDFRIQSYFRVFMLQGFLQILIILPVLAIHLYSSAFGLSIFHYLGIALWAIGFVYETVADIQLVNFRSDSSNHKKVLNSGLWCFSRHPNYFGDALQWFAFFIFSLPTGYYWGIISPLTMLFIFLRLTIRLLERPQTNKRPEYEEYVKSTNIFFPGWKKN
jgi:steroid 5-alpha reductase family enzyme